MAIGYIARAALAIAVAATIAVYPYARPEMPPFVAFGLPCTAAVIWWLFARLNGDRGPNARRIENAGAMTALFLAIFHLTMLAAFISRTFWLGRWLGLIVGVFLIVTGNELPRFHRNLVWGVRTPHTLRSDAVWKRVHRLAGYVQVAIGGGVAAASLGTESGSPELIPLALGVEAILCCAAGLLFSRSDRPLALFGSS
jgi:hypothetical protein